MVNYIGDTNAAECEASTTLDDGSTPYNPDGYAGQCSCSFCLTTDCGLPADYDAQPSGQVSVNAGCVVSCESFGGFDCTMNAGD